jgi:redox-sensitive bicupin YhaK (pirin superfamily)
MLTKASARTKNSLGNIGRTVVGDIQVMSAGTGSSSRWQYMV